MIVNDTFILQENQTRERELTERLERRRQLAEREVARHGGDRLAFIAELARKARAGSAGVISAATH